MTKNKTKNKKTFGAPNLEQMCLRLVKRVTQYKRFFFFNIIYNTCCIKVYKLDVRD